MEVVALPRHDWQWGDLVVAEVTTPPGANRQVELTDGRMAEVDVGDQIVGAFGVRAATLEATGTWEIIGEDGRFDLLTSAGLFGCLTSCSPFIAPPVALQYVGHAVREGRKQTMAACVPAVTEGVFDLPVLLIVGSSMSAGKTASARKIIRRLTAMGQRVVGVKLTGAGRARDILSMKDAGAVAVFDFVDAGLPSTVCDEALFREAAGGLLARIAQVPADIAVIEAGASPLEPYNGEAAMDLLAPHVRMTLLCASDPYSVVGICQAFERKPDLVAGIACNTNAGQALIERLTGLPALRLVRCRETPELDAILRARFDLDPIG